MKSLTILQNPMPMVRQNQLSASRPCFPDSSLPQRLEPAPLVRPKKSEIRFKGIDPDLIIMLFAAPIAGISLMAGLTLAYLKQREKKEEKTDKSGQ